MQRRTIAAYGLLGLPLAVVGLPLAIYLPPLYTQERGLAAAMVGGILLLARLADVFVDPLIGAFSDRIVTPLGRRRPWIIAGTLLTMVGVLHVFSPPPHPDWRYLLGWICVLYAGWSLVTIPYLAWGGGLSDRYHTRSVITGTREAFGMLGIITASVLPAIVPGSLAAPMRDLAWVIIGLLPCAALLLMLVVPEPAPAGGEALQDRPTGNTTPKWGPWRLLWRNRPFRLLIFAAALGGIGTAVNGTLVIFFLQQMDLGDHKELLLLYLLSAMGGIPLWVWLASRVGKHRALCYATFWGCAWFAIIPLMSPGPASYWPIALVNVMAGCTIGASPVLGASMAADVIDWDALRSRRDRSGLFFSLWSMVTKMTSAMGVLALPLVVALGFHPIGANTPHGRSVLITMYCLVPIGFWLMAVSLLWNFPIDRRRQAWIAARRLATQ